MKIMRSSRAPVTDAFHYLYDAGWREVREPDAGATLVFGLVAGATLCITTFVLWLVLVPFKPIRVDYVTLVVALVVVLVLHELTHGVVFTWHSPRTRRVEIVWRRHHPHIRYEGATSRLHYLAVLAMPFFAISLAPIAAAMLLGIGPGDLVLVSLVNALFCGADLVAFVLVREQVPAGATVRRQGDYLLWKPRAIASGKSQQAVQG
jgi:hypothetical protein